MKIAMHLAFALTATALSLVACTDQPEVDELAGEIADDAAGDSKADGASDSVYTYFTVRADTMRRCASPMCGGKFLKRVNRSTTVCHTGRAATECYVPALDYTGLGLSEDQVNLLADRPLLVRGRFAAKLFPGTLGNLGTFIVTEAWQAQSDNTPEGVFVRIKDSGARCVAAPCENKQERALNGSRKAQISEIRWEDADMTDEALIASIQSTFQEGTIVAGNRFTVRVGSRTSKGRTATAVYRKVQPAVAAACFVGGCSSQVCSDREGVITTCEYRPEYACFQDAQCARQSDGACGWTATPALDACLAGN
ncbi:MAG: hypothetical protein KBG15_16005 [Kofleriaceae bacterium]|nr:hypothetical protein [Kofleriaceae bacterium]